MTHPMEETQNSEQVAPQYEAPRIESVLAPEELEREVLYAGAVVVSPLPD